MVRSSLLLIVAISLFLTVSASHYDGDHTCIHGKLKHNPIILDVPSDEDGDGRFLQEYQTMRIYFDYTKISDSAVKEYRDYIINVIIPPCKNFLEAALKVKPISQNLTLKGIPTLCDGNIKVPGIYDKEGVPADLVMFVDIVNDSSQDFVAFTTPCVLGIVNKRPLFGRLAYNAAKLQPSTNNVIIERDISVTLHESTHVLGFSGTLFDYFIDPATNKLLKGHLFQKEVNGVNTTVLNVEPLTSRLRRHFNCPTLEGAYLENQGNVGNAGVHFERRVIYNDYMTASTMKDSKITEFTLAVLEGSGWYQVDYSLSEPITWGKNKGCSFLNGPCIDPTTKNSNFDEFCSPLGSSGCSWTGRGASICGSSKLKTKSDLPAAFDYWGNKTVVNDIFADNCPIYDIFSNLDCEDEDVQTRSVLPNHEFYGYQSKCFMGTLGPAGKITTPYYFCFKPSCEMQANGNYYVKVNVGKNVVTCKSKTQISVLGLGGKLFCPDPNLFCNQITSEGFCRRGCSGRGTCVDKQCQCVDGWGYHDCSRKIYVDNCKRCEGKDPFRTSCYADTCECNPNNTTCVTPLDNNDIDYIDNESSLDQEEQKDSYSSPKNISNPSPHDSGEILIEKDRDKTKNEDTTSNGQEEKMTQEININSDSLGKNQNIQEKPKDSYNYDPSKNTSNPYPVDIGDIPLENKPFLLDYPIDLYQNITSGDGTKNKDTASNGQYMPIDNLNSKSENKDENKGAPLDNKNTISPQNNDSHYNGNNSTDDNEENTTQEIKINSQSLVSNQNSQEKPNDSYTYDDIGNDNSDSKHEVKNEDEEEEDDDESRRALTGIKGLSFANMQLLMLSLSYVLCYLNL